MDTTTYLMISTYFTLTTNDVQYQQSKTTKATRRNVVKRLEPRTKSNERLRRLMGTHRTGLAVCTRPLRSIVNTLLRYCTTGGYVYFFMVTGGIGRVHGRTMLAFQNSSSVQPSAMDTRWTTRRYGRDADLTSPNQTKTTEGTIIWNLEAKVCSRIRCS